MRALPLCAAALSLLTTLTAQQGQPQNPPAPKPATEAAADSEAVREPTPQERVEKLRVQVEKLRSELEALQQVEASGGLTARVKTRLKVRELATRSIPDPHPRAQVAPPPAPTAKKEARLLGDDEKANIGADVVFTVDGQPVTKSEFDQALAYLTSYPRTESEEQLKTQAVLELVRVKAAQAAFSDTGPQARTKILEIQRKLSTGEIEFAELAKTSSDCPSKTRGGDLGYFGRVGMDFWFTKTAFGLEVGEVSDVIPSTFGYHLIKVTGVEKGKTPDRDRVRASHILALYTPNQALLGAVMRRVNDGQVDLAFASEDMREFTPANFK